MSGRRLPRIADGLGKRDALIGAEAEGFGEGVAVDHSADDGVEAGGGAVEVGILADEAGFSATVEQPVRVGDAPHLREIGNVDEIQGGSGGEGLAASERTQVAGGDELEAVVLRVVEVRGVGEDDVDIHGLPVHGGGRGAVAIGTVDAVGGPEEIREDVEGERLRGEFAGAVAFCQGLHQWHAGFGVGRGERDGGGRRGTHGGGGGQENSGDGAHESL